jgi:hypothetical protein
MYESFVIMWAKTMMDIRAGYLFMALQLHIRSIIAEWYKMLPYEARESLISSSSSLHHPFIYLHHVRTCLQTAKKVQTLQGKCREVIQENLRGGSDLKDLPLPPLICDYIKELEPTLCFRILIEVFNTKKLLKNKL